MRLVIQCVLEVVVIIDGFIYGKIGNGLLVLVGIEVGDMQEDIEWLV